MQPWSLASSGPRQTDALTARAVTGCADSFIDMLGRLLGNNLPDTLGKIHDKKSCLPILTFMLTIEIESWRDVVVERFVLLDVEPNFLSVHDLVACFTHGEVLCLVFILQVSYKFPAAVTFPTTAASWTIDYHACRYGDINQCGNCFVLFKVRG